MSAANRVVVPSGSIRHNWPVFAFQFGSLAYNVPLGAMARSLGWFIIGSWAITVTARVVGSIRSTLCPT